MGIAKDLLKAADQYLLDGLKRLCEYTMAQVSYLFLFIDTCFDVCYANYVNI